MTITITLNLDEEQTNALADVVAQKNAMGTDPITEEQYLQQLLEAEVGAYVRIAYDKSVERLGEAAKLLPYSARQSLISQVAAAVSVNP